VDDLGNSKFPRNSPRSCHLIWNHKLTPTIHLATGQDWNSLHNLSYMTYYYT